MADTQKKSASLYSAFKEVINPQKLKPATQTITNGDMNNIILQINEMMRTIYNKAFGKLKVSIKEGGTGADNAPGALLNLGIEMPADEINNLPKEFEIVYKAIGEALSKADNAVKKSGDTMTGALKVSGTISSGEKTSANDGKPGVAMGRTGYILIQREDSGKPYITFYMPNATTSSGLIQTSASAMEFRNASKYDFSGPIVINGANVLTDSDPLGLSNTLKTLFLGNIGSAPNSLASGDNIDNLAPGTYKSTNASTSASLSGTVPTTSAGFRLVVSNLTSSSTYVQVAVGYSSEVNIWVRVKTSAWGAWKKLSFA